MKKLVFLLFGIMVFFNSAKLYADAVRLFYVFHDSNSDSLDSPDLCLYTDPYISHILAVCDAMDRHCPKFMECRGRDSGFREVVTPHYMIYASWQVSDYYQDFVQLYTLSHQAYAVFGTLNMYQSSDGDFIKSIYDPNQRRLDQNWYSILTGVEYDANTDSYELKVGGKHLLTNEDAPLTSKYSKSVAMFVNFTKTPHYSDSKDETRTHFYHSLSRVCIATDINSKDIAVCKPKLVKDKYSITYVDPALDPEKDNDNSDYNDKRLYYVKQDIYKCPTFTECTNNPSGSVKRTGRDYIYTPNNPNEKTLRINVKKANTYYLYGRIKVCTADPGKCKKYDNDYVQSAENFYK